VDWTPRSEDSPGGGSPIGDLPVGTTPSLNPFLIAETAAGFAIPGRRQKVHRALSAADGHSTGEQALYEALWNHGAPETENTRLLTIGYGGMQGLCRLDKTNCKKNVLSLIEKRALEVAGSFDIRRNRGNTYRVFSPEAVLLRRIEAGLLYVIRTSGVRFVSPSG
jgi:hypothetical protein